MSRYLVTGATGYVGNRLVALLAAKGHDVRAYHRASSRLDLLAGVRYEPVVGELDDAATLARGMEGCDGVFHVAGIISYSTGDLALLRTSNVAPVGVVLDAVRRAGVRRLVHTSTIGTIGYAAAPGGVTDETNPYNWPDGYDYFETKREAERLALDAASAGLDVVVVNPTVILGPGDPKGTWRPLLAPLSKGLMPFHVPGSFNAVDVDDVAAGHALAMDRGRSGERYILGGENTTSRGMLEEMARALGVQAPFVPVPSAAIRAGAAALRFAENFGFRMRPSGSRFLSASLFNTWTSSAKAERELGYGPRLLPDIIRRTIEDYRTRGWL